MFYLLITCVLTEQNFANHESTWEDPLMVVYHGKTIRAPPPNSEGMAKK
ncbi:hypothetical protein WMZ97_06300 [Lentibacillus sp. N15]